jgi:hypothetical protein
VDYRPAEPPRGYSRALGIQARPLEVFEAMGLADESIAGANLRRSTADGSGGLVVSDSRRACC